MISPRPFQAHQFALLHLLGLLSISKPRESHNPDSSAQESEDAALLILPQEVIINAYCYLTEQIHEVAKPPERLEKVVTDVYNLSSFLVPPPPAAAAGVAKPSPSNSRTTRRGSTRSPTKRASISPSTSTRSLRRSTSRATAATTAASESSSVTPPPPPPQHAASMPIVEGEEAPRHTFSIDGSPPDSSRGAFPLAHRLYTNVMSDMKMMQYERSEALFASLAEFRVLLGDLDNPNNVAFLDRTSPLGMWLRRANLNLNTMTFVETEELIDDLLSWGGLSETPPARDLEERVLFSVTSTVSSDSNTLKTRTEIFEAYNEAMRKEDYSKSLDLMQRFFDYETFPFAGGSSANRGMRQHALLNLAQFHLVHGEFQAARIAAHEGMKVARQTSDLVALNALTSILKKVNFEDSSERMEYRDGGHGDAFGHEAGKEDFGGYVPPVDYLWDVRFGLATRVPLPSLMFDLLRAKALNYFAANQKLNLSSKERRKEKKLAAQQGKDALNAGGDAQQKRLRWNRLDSIAWLATASDLWERMGSADLAHTYQLMSFITKKGDIDPYGGARMVMRCKQADALAHQGHFDTALATLLAEVMHPDRMKLTVRHIQTWQRAVYSVLRLQAERSENRLLVQEIDRICPPVPPGTDFPRRTSDGPVKSALGFPTIEVEPKTESGLIGEIESLIQRAEKYLDMEQHAAATPLAVRASALSSLADGQGFLPLYWRATLVLVRVQVAIRTCDRALRILNEVWADILGSLDKELIAYAREVRANTLLALVDEVIKERQTAAEEGDLALAEAASLYFQSSEDHRSLGSTSKQIEGLMKSAKLYHRMGDLENRDRMAKLCKQASLEWQNSKRRIHQDQITRFSHIQHLCAYASAIAALK